MAGSTQVILSKTRINPTLGSGTTILTLAREVETAGVLEAGLIGRVHGTPTITNLTSVRLVVWGVAPSSEDPGYEFVIRKSTTTLDPVEFAVVVIPVSGYGSLTGANYWAGLSPVNINGTTQQGNFGPHLRVVLEIIATSSPVLDMYLSVALDLKS